MSGIVSKNGGRSSGIVGAGDVGADAVDGSNIADDAIDSEHYADGSIDNAHIADDAIDSEHYADGSIDNAHIADDAIDSEHYAEGSIDEAHIADNAVTLAKMAGGTDGQIITFDASGNPTAVGPGTDGQVLTSTGAGSPPAFEAASSGGTTTGFLTGLSSTLNNVTGDGTLYSWTGATYTDIYDEGTNFASGTFTAPVTGKYMFIHNFYTSTVTSSHTMCQTNLITSNRTYVTGKFNPYNALGGGSDISFQAVFLADMDACDTASVSQKFENGAKTMDYYSSGSAGTAYTYFIGALVHE